jgi:hypothetical protein
MRVYYGIEEQGLSMRLGKGDVAAAFFLRNQLTFRQVTRQEGISLRTLYREQKSSFPLEVNHFHQS